MRYFGPIKMTLTLAATGFHARRASGVTSPRCNAVRRDQYSVSTSAAQIVHGSVTPLHPAPRSGATGETAGVQGQAFLVTFGANAKSDWPRAAMERDGGRRAHSAKNELGWYQFVVG